MRLGAEAQRDLARAPARGDLLRCDRGAERDAAGEQRRVGGAEADPFAHQRAQAVRADENVAGLAHRDEAALEADRDAVAVRADPGDLGPQTQRDIGQARRRLGERALQIGAVNDEIGRAPAPLGVLDRQSRQLGVVAAAQDADRARRRGEAAHGFEDAQSLENAGRVGRELKPRAEFLEDGRAFEDLDLEILPRERERGGQPADPGAGDERATRHGSRRVVKFALGGNRVRAERRIIDEARRAIGADRFRVAAHVDEDVRMVERRLGARAHEFLDADPDRGDAGVVVKMRDEVIRHFEPSFCSAAAASIKHVRSARDSLTAASNGRRAARADCFSPETGAAY